MTNTEASMIRLRYGDTLNQREREGDYWRASRGRKEDEGERARGEGKGGRGKERESEIGSRE